MTYKLLDTFVYGSVALLIVLSVILANEYEKDVEECRARNGILVDSAEGYICLDRNLKIV